MRIEKGVCEESYRVFDDRNEVVLGVTYTSAVPQIGTILHRSLEYVELRVPDADKISFCLIDGKPGLTDKAMLRRVEQLDDRVQTAIGELPEYVRKAIMAVRA